MREIYIRTISQQEPRYRDSYSNEFIQIRIYSLGHPTQPDELCSEDGAKAPLPLRPSLLDRAVPLGDRSWVAKNGGGPAEIRPHTVILATGAPEKGGPLLWKTLMDLFLLPFEQKISKPNGGIFKMLQ